MEDIQGTSAELLIVAGSNKWAPHFLLGYVSSELSPPVIREAIFAYREHEAQGKAFEYLFETAAQEIYDPRD